MLRPIAGAIAVTMLAALGGHAESPAYTVQSAPARKVETTFKYEVRYPNLKATEWEIVVARPPDLPGQAVSRVTVTPAGADGTEAGALKQPVVRVLIKPESDAERQRAKVAVTTEATTMSRRLVPLAAGKTAPAVRPLGDDERKVYLAPTPHVDFDGEAFQRWLDANKLRLQKKESEVDFARRVFLALKKALVYKRPFGHDGKASSTVGAGSGDCGCLSAVFVAALRANGVPARELVGRLVKSDRPFEQTEYGIHARAEFYAARVGWVPADPSFGLADKSPLNHFGNDAGDLLVFHLDGDLVYETRSFGKATLYRLQGAGLWVSGGGNLEGPESKEDWRVRDLPLNPKKK